MSAFGKFVVVMAVVMLAISLDKASAGDPDMLQDVCVADLTNSKFNLTSSVLKRTIFLFRRLKINDHFSLFFDNILILIFYLL